jgi:predicted MFS family arabinose efflux permease
VFFATASQAYLPTLLGPGDLLEGNAKLHGSESATQVAGPGLGGLLVQMFGAAQALVFDAVSFFYSLVCTLCIRAREPERVATRHQESVLVQVRTGLRFVAGDPYLRPIITYGVLMNLGLTGYQTIQIVFLAQTLHVGASAIGGLIAVAGLGGLLGALVARPLGRRFGTARGVLVCQLVTGPFALLAPLAGPGAGLAFYALGTFVMIAGVVACNVVLNSFRQLYSPPQFLGRVLATSMFLVHSSIPLGALAAGYLGDLYGPRTTMWIMAALIAPCGLVLPLSPMRARRDLPTGPRQPAAAA